MKVAIIDYGAGNVKSVENALMRLGVCPVLTGDTEEILAADRVIFPGVGHAQHAMQQLHTRNLHTIIPRLTQPTLGICLGMQLMCAFSAEGNTNGLGIFENVHVLRFQHPLKIPHTGWNIAFGNNLPPRYFYFVHSYYVPLNRYTILACEYGNAFSAAMSKNNFSAVQFHPEKSSTAGELLLGNFLKRGEI